jgi:hypothetical protein
MAHRFSWASFTLNNVSIFFRLLHLIAQNVAEHFNLNSGIRVRVRGSCAEDVNLGSLTGIKIV